MKKALKILTVCLILVLAVGAVVAVEGEEGAATPSDDNTWKIAIAAAIAIGAAAIASAYGIAHAGSAAMAAMAEKPEVATWGVIIVALAEGLALYGLVIAFMIIGKM
ncbi:MAG: ATP synthase subunit C [Candidatus Hydrothermarchaeales archaeon]